MSVFTPLVIIFILLLNYYLYKKNSYSKMRNLQSNIFYGYNIISPICWNIIYIFNRQILQGCKENNMIICAIIISPKYSN